jgi:antitoxin HicB
MKDLTYYNSLPYAIELTPEEDGRFTAEIPDLPGCTSFGDSPNDAVAGLELTKELWIKGRLDAGQLVPEPSDLDDYSGKFLLRIPRTLHKSLAHEARREGTSLNQYVTHLLSERHAIEQWRQATSTAFVAVTAQKIWASSFPKWGCRPIDLETPGYDPNIAVQIIPKPQANVLFTSKSTLQSYFKHGES